MDNPKQELRRDLTRKELRESAASVLAENHEDGFTKPAPHLYPHQWSWDSAFISIGLSYLELEKALAELVTLFKGQWADGRVPHILFNPNSGDYFPGPEYWNCKGVSQMPPVAPLTSGLIQPPVHGLAAHNVWRVASMEGSAEQFREPLNGLFDKLLSWHRYLSTSRDPEGIGLISVYHPWESGLDNSPRWDSVLAGIETGTMPEFQRRDTKHVKDSAERPTDEEYRKYMWLVELLKRYAYDDIQIHRSYPFVVKDVLMSAIFNLSNHALVKLGRALGREQSELDFLSALADRSRSGVLEKCLEPDSAMVYDLDMRRAGEKIKVSTCANLAGILLGDLDSSMKSAMRDLAFSKQFCGHGSLRFPVVPSTTPDTVGFKTRSYWRGPSWPVLNWLFSYALAYQGFTEDSETLKKANLAMLSQEQAQFGEYFSLETGEPLGSLKQSWTAAVTIDWLSDRSLLRSF